VWSSGFAALVVMFSPGGIGVQHDVTISGSVVWIPWVLWAMEVWLKSPTTKNAVLFGGLCALSAVAGYPMTFHGIVFYLFATLLVTPFQKEARADWKKLGASRLATGTIAIAVCLGLVAVQWLPLAELVNLSNRQAGTYIVLNALPIALLRGFVTQLATAPNWPSVGSMLVCVLASFCLVVVAPARTKGHLLATLLLIQMGIGTASPFFHLFHDGLIPGFRYFRWMHVYLNVAIVGIAVLAAFAIDGMVRWQRSEAAHGVFVHNTISRWNLVGALLAIAGLWVWCVAALWPDISILQCVLAVVGLVGCMVLKVARRALRIPIFLTILVATECAIFQFPSFYFANADVIERPASVAAIQAEPNWMDYKVYDNSSTMMYAFAGNLSPELVPRMQKALAAFCGLSNLMWNMPSINGHMALQLKRWMDVNPLLSKEVRGEVATPPGRRLIDILGVRYIASDGPGLSARTPTFLVRP
jgi:hypothetical protein